MRFKAQKRYLTNVNVGFGTLESRSQPTGSQYVLGEKMVNRIHSARPQQGGPAGAHKKIGTSGESRHPDDQAMKRQTEQHKECDGTQWTLKRVEMDVGIEANFRRRLSQHPANQAWRIAEGTKELVLDDSKEIGFLEQLGLLKVMWSL